MDLSTFLRDGQSFSGQFRPFRQEGYMLEHVPPDMDIPNGLCRALSCAFVTYNYSKDDNQPFWLDASIYASKKLFSALGASKTGNYAGYGTIKGGGAQHKKLFDDVARWQSTYQVDGQQSEDEWKTQIQNSLSLVSAQFMNRPLKVLNATESFKADQHLALSPLLKAEPGFYLHSPGGHHMTAAVVRPGKYKFFDPNYGQMKFESGANFRNFVRTYFNRSAFQVWSFSCGA